MELPQIYENAKLKQPRRTSWGILLMLMVYNPEKHKVAAILEYPESTAIEQLRAFNGLVRFYERFIPNCASFVKPLTDQLHRN
uniref:SJCHGC07085 protein n=1 Tax=Schistosoma japonicum TaxID=6182 RepID=Q5BRX5_SCHJA|nr:SJCHGC07085 protein [Schistosoma japonicum]